MTSILKNIYTYRMPEVVIKRSLKELNNTRTWYEKLFNLNEYTEEDYIIIESRLFDYFVVAAAEPTEMMDEEADIIWHNFLLDTKSYQQFCEEYVGRFIHHIPYVEKNHVQNTFVDEITKNMVHTINAYRQEHNLLPLNVGPYLDYGYYFESMQCHITSYKGG